MEILTIQAKSLNLSEEEFFNFCQENEQLRFERTADKEILVMTPTGIDTSWSNSNLNLELGIWNRNIGKGYLFDSNAGFTLPNGAVRSPDASWISKERVEFLDANDRKRFAHICPDFVAEIHSESDNLETLKNKMQEYVDNGARLGWLLDCVEEKAYIFKPDKSISVISSFKEKISGENVLVGFELDLSVLKS
ncbi:MAG: Uma2 family endonuclease [Cytophagales bacterium]|nr:Uma2 family endonuclease [Cytophagales bacterium]